jgi:hypothetical protein
MTVSHGGSPRSKPPARLVTQDDVAAGQRTTGGELATKRPNPSVR